MPGVLQTFGSAGAGRGWDAGGATNIRLRWSREGMEGGTLEEGARSRDASVKYPSDRRSANVRAHPYRRGATPIVIHSEGVQRTEESTG